MANNPQWSSLTTLDPNQAPVFKASDFTTFDPSQYTTGGAEGSGGGVGPEAASLRLNGPIGSSGYGTNYVLIPNAGGTDLSQGFKFGIKGGRDSGNVWSYAPDGNGNFVPQGAPQLSAGRNSLFDSNASNREFNRGTLQMAALIAGGAAAGAYGAGGEAAAGAGEAGAGAGAAGGAGEAAGAAVAEGAPAYAGPGSSAAAGGGAGQAGYAGGTEALLGNAGEVTSMTPAQQAAYYGANSSTPTSASTIGQYLRGGLAVGGLLGGGGGGSTGATPQTPSSFGTAGNLGPRGQQNVSGPSQSPFASYFRSPEGQDLMNRFGQIGSAGAAGNAAGAILRQRMTGGMADPSGMPTAAPGGLPPGGMIPPATQQAPTFAPGTAPKMQPPMQPPMSMDPSSAFGGGGPQTGGVGPSGAAPATSGLPPNWLSMLRGQMPPQRSPAAAY